MFHAANIVVETAYNFEDYQITIYGELFSVDGSTIVYGDNPDDWGSYDFDAADVSVIQRMSDLEEIDWRDIDKFARDYALRQIHEKLGMDTLIPELLEREYR